MLQRLHRHTKGVIAWIFLGLLILAFGSFGISYYLNNQATEKAIAKVNGIKISAQQMDTAYKRLRQQFEQQFQGQVPVTPVLEKALKQQALDQLIQSQIIAYAAAKQGLRIGDAQLATIIKNMPTFQQEGEFSAQRYEQVLSQAGYTKQQFLAQMRTELMIEQYKNGVLQSAFALPQEVDHAIQLLNQQRKIRYLTVPDAKFMAQTRIPDAEIKDYYQQNAKIFQIPAKVKLAYIELTLADIVKKTKITDQAIKENYQANLRSYQPPAQWRAAHISLTIPDDASPKQVAALKAKLQAIALQVKQGADFSKLAQQHSDDVLSAQDGGQLPWITEGTLKNSRFEKTALSLKKGAVSEPIRTKYGYSLIKLIDMKRPPRIPLANVKQQIRENLQQQQAQQTFTATSEQLANLVYMQPNSLQETADTLKLPLKKTDWITQDNAPDLLNSPKVLQATFSPEVIEQGLNSDVIQVTPEHLIVLRKIAYEPAKPIPLSQVKQQIKLQLQQAQARKLAKQYGEKLIQKLQSGQAIMSDLRQQKLQWKTATITQQETAGVPMPAIQAAFALPTPQQNEKPVRGGVMPNGFVIVELEKVILAELTKLTDKQRQAWRQQLSQTNGELDYALYINEMRNQADIKQISGGSSGKFEN